MNFERLQKLYKQKQYPILSVKPGQFVEIHENVGEGDTKRIWKFKGLVIKVKKPNHPDGTFTVRGQVARMTIEKIYPLSFDRFEKVLLMDEYKVRRAKLYYIRDKVGKAAKMKSLLGQSKEVKDLFALAVEEAEKRAAEGKAAAPAKEEKVEEVKVEEVTPVAEEVNVEEAPKAEETPVEEKVEEVKEEKVEEKVEEAKEEAPAEEAAEEEKKEDKAE